MDLQGDDHCRNNWIRGLCQYGIMPANGLTYAPPHSCGCFMEAKLYGFWAVSAQREDWKVDSPPAIHGGAAIFGGRDGWVYCLDLADGLFLYALDPQTGKIVHRKQFASERPAIFGPEETKELESKYPSQRISQNTVDFRTFASPDKSDSFSMNGNMNDVISGDGEHVFLRHLTFDFLRHLTFDARWQRCEEMLPHLFSTSRFTDGNENHRSHWCMGSGFFGRTIYAYPWIPERFGKQLNHPIGLMLVYKDQQAWGIQRTASGAGSYTLFSKDRPAYLAGDPYAAFEGRAEGLLRVFAASDGTASAEIELDAPVVWDGMAAAGGRLVMALTDGTVVCFEGEK